MAQHTSKSDLRRGVLNALRDTPALSVASLATITRQGIMRVGDIVQELRAERAVRGKNAALEITAKGRMLADVPPPAPKGERW